MSKREAELLPPEPRDGRGAAGKARRQEQRIVRALLKAYIDVGIGQRQERGCVDEVAEDVVRFRFGVAVAHLCAEESIQTARHDRQLQVAVDFHRHR